MGAFTAFGLFSPLAYSQADGGPGTDPILPEPAEAAPPPDYGPDVPSTEPSLPGPEPEVTIVERDKATFEEYRINGRLYKIKVTPKVGPPYYLIDELGDNIWRRYDASGPSLHVPRWVILEF